MNSNLKLMELKPKEFNFIDIDNFGENYEGSKRLYNKSRKIIGRKRSVLGLNQWDTEDAISDIYWKLLEYHQIEHEEKTPMKERSQKYYGLKTLEEFSEGHHAVQKIFREGSKATNRHIYSQDYALFGTIEIDDYAEIELDATLENMFDEKALAVLNGKRDGWSMKEISAKTGIPKRTIERILSEVKEVLKLEFNVNEDERKSSKRVKKIS